MFVACTACHARFDAASYRDVLCPTCGVVAQPRPCPRCLLPLQPRHIHDLVLDECSQCHGMFLDATVKRLLAEQDVDRAEALFAALAADAPARKPDGDHASTPCPVCGVGMHPKLSDTGAGVVIDICKPHGAFYDGGELQRLLAFAHHQAQMQAIRDAELERYKQQPDEADDALDNAAMLAALGSAAALSLLVPYLGHILFSALSAARR